MGAKGQLVSLLNDVFWREDYGKVGLEARSVALYMLAYIHVRHIRVGLVT